MKLQRDLDSLNKAKVQVVAVSYDSVDVLAKFAEQKKVEFPLLSDVNSKTIDAFGVRNNKVKGTRQDGIPHPGTFLLDDKGIVRAKLFHAGIRKRHLAKDILDAASRMKEEKRKAS